MKTLAITSINPHSKIPYQKICFDKWKEIGIEIKTFNTEAEKKILLANGFNLNDIIEIDISESARDLFGKDMPRILPVLNRAAKYYDSYFIVNSDIYPAIVKNPSPTLLSFGSALCLTRNECEDVSMHEYIDSNPYRGGIDIFFFTNQGFLKIVNRLNSFELSGRMAFGIPGWDYYLAHHILEIKNDSIFDSEIFLHQSHKTTYTNLDEFDHYANSMIQSARYISKNKSDLVVEFAKKINELADENNKKSNFLKKIYYSSIRLIPQSHEIDKKGDLAKKIQGALTNAGYPNINIKNLNSFLFSQSSEVSWIAGVAFCKKNFRGLNEQNIYLITIMIMLFLREHFAISKYTNEYPKGNMHAIALQQILDNTKNPERYIYILGLFGSELIDYSIFNPLLFNYIILSCKSRREIALCTQIKKIILEEI